MKVLASLVSTVVTQKIATNIKGTHSYLLIVFQNKIV